jgi:hypothetical protein
MPLSSSSSSRQFCEPKGAGRKGPDFPERRPSEVFRRYSSKGMGSMQPAFGAASVVVGDPKRLRQGHTLSLRDQYRPRVGPANEITDGFTTL